MVRSSLQELPPLVLPHHAPHGSLFLLADAAGYSLASYYTSLGLFVISVPGLWSLIKRSVKSKVVTLKHLSFSLFCFPLLFWGA